MKIKSLSLSLLLIPLISISKEDDNSFYDAKQTKVNVESRYSELNLTSRFIVNNVKPIVNGGLSSDVYIVEVKDVEMGVENKTHVLKYPMSKLKTKNEDKVPLDRTKFEVNYFRFASDISKSNFPNVIANDEKGFLMEFFPSEKYPVFRKELCRYNVNSRFYKSLGRVLARVHKNSISRKDEIINHFDSMHVFRDMRWNIYFEPLKYKFPEISWYINELESRFFDECSRTVLSHGDFVSKNILFNLDNPVILDAETAAFTPPELDLGFFIVDTLFLVKDKNYQSKVNDSLQAFIHAYEGIMYEGLEQERVEAREHLAFFLPAMILSRIHGGSLMPLDNQLQALSVTESILDILMAKENFQLESVLRAWEKAMY